MQPGCTPASAVSRETLCAPSVQIAVRNQRAIEGHADLAAMSMSRHDQIVPVAGHRIDHAAIRRMCDANRNINLVAVDRARDLGIMILSQMRIIGAAEAEPYAFDLQRRAGVCQVDPAGFLETSPEILPWESLLRTTISATRAPEVTQRVLECRCVVIVGTPDIHARTFQQPPEASQHEGHSILVREVIAGVDHQIRLQRTKSGQPALACPEMRRHVDIG